MTDEDITRMAREAQQERLSLDGGSPSPALSGHWFSMEVADLARFAALVRADERERIAAEWDGHMYGDTEDIDIGAAIRARSKE